MRLRARCAERDVNENMFSVLLEFVYVRKPLLMKGHCGERMAGLPEVSEDGIM